jgi:hypothetical protein
MGIPEIVKFLAHRYKGCLLPLRKGIHYDYVYVDMNYILHRVKNIRSRGMAKDIERRLAGALSPMECSSGIYIAMDGPASLAKVKEQRHRRKRGDVDSCVLTPGSIPFSFINRATEQIIKNLRHRPRYLNTAFGFSSSNVPDEGELKIASQIRAHAQEFPDASHLVLGGDTDLVLICSAMHNVSNVYVMLDHKNCLFSVDHLRNLMQADIDKNIADPSCRPSMQHVISDFIFFSFFFGNDYLSGWQGFDFQAFWEHYLKTRGTLEVSSSVYCAHNGLNVRYMYDLLKDWRDSGAASAKSPQIPAWAQMDSAILTATPSLVSPAVKKNVLSRLRALVWAFRLYSEAVCPDSSYVTPSAHHNGLSVTDLKNVLQELASESPFLPLSFRPLWSNGSIPSAQVVLLLLPYNAIPLVPPALQELAELPALQFLYEEERCHECKDYAAEVRRLSSLLGSLYERRGGKKASKKESKLTPDEWNEVETEIKQTRHQLSLLNPKWDQHRGKHPTVTGELAASVMQAVQALPSKALPADYASECLRVQRDYWWSPVGRGGAGPSKRKDNNKSRMAARDLA